jgi:hypothetical protein
MDITESAAEYIEKEIAELQNPALLIYYSKVKG